MLVGLYGASRAGKDSVASILVKNHEFEQRNLASLIRTVLLTINPAMINNFQGATEPYTYMNEAVSLYGWDGVKARWPWSVDAMIALGQGMRDIDESIWLNACIKEPFENLVIADVRQPNEAEFIYAQGGELWRIEREGTEKRGMDGILDDYEFSVEIKNDMDLDWLESLVNIIMEGRK